jgi:hypothetical protein
MLSIVSNELTESETKMINTALHTPDHMTATTGGLGGVRFAPIDDRSVKPRRCEICGQVENVCLEDLMTDCERDVDSSARESLAVR